MDAQHILVSGAGIGGLTAALCLAQAGHRVEVFEQAAISGGSGCGHPAERQWYARTASSGVAAENSRFELSARRR